MNLHNCTITRTRSPNTIFCLKHCSLSRVVGYIGFFCYIEPHNLLFLVATKVSFWFFLSLNINDPHNILFTGFLSLQFAKKCKQNCIKRAFRILWTLSIKLGTWYITLLLLPFLRDLCIRETYDVGRK